MGRRTHAQLALCNGHRELLNILVRYGKGVMLLSQLRAICLATGLYPSGQAVNRVVRKLREANVLTRQTWVDGNGDLVVARKAVFEFLNNPNSRAVATPPRPATMAPYLAQARKIDWLLRVMEVHRPDSPDAIEKFLRGRGCTAFLRQSELLDYYRRYKPYLSENKGVYEAEVRYLKGQELRREHLARHLPPPENNVPQTVTLEQMHLRGIYIDGFSPSGKMICLIFFPNRNTSAGHIMDWAIDACWWIRGIFPGYQVKLTLHALDAAHKESLKRSLEARTRGQAYWRARLAEQKIEGMLHLSAYDSDFVDLWCCGVRSV